MTGDLAERWRARVRATCTAVPSAAALDRLAHVVHECATAALAGDEDAAAAGRRIGAALVAERLTVDGAVAATTAVLAEHAAAATAAPDRAGALLGGVAEGFAQALAALVLRQQEEIHSALVAARDTARTELTASDARFRTLFAAAGVGIGVGDLDGRILDCNPALLRMLGYTLEEMQARTVAQFLHPSDAASVWSAYQELVTGRRDLLQTEKWFYRSDGGVVRTHLTVTLVRDADGVPVRQVSIMEDVTPRYELEQRLRHAATHDVLTGLPNRALLVDRLEAAVADADALVGLCYLDLDGFKMVNDGLGHRSGDDVLVAAAGRFLAVAADVAAGWGVPADGVPLVARLGGDEFVVLAHGAPGTDELLDLADRLAAALADPVDLPDGLRVELSTSVGVAQRRPGVDRDVDSASALLRAADLALQTAKADGRARIAVHEPARAGRQLARYALAMSLPGAVRRDELDLVYQPLVSLGPDGSGLQVWGAEALLRWRHPEHGRVAPASFVAIAEETGGILELGRWVLRRACQDVAAWGSQWPDDAVLSVNVSMAQLHLPEVVDEVLDITTAAGIEPERLQLEVTESTILRPEATRPVPAGEPLLPTSLAR